MREALDQNFWISDIQGALTVSALAEYLELRNLVTEVELQPDVHVHQLRLTQSGMYSSMSAYRSRLLGR